MKLFNVRVSLQYTNSYNQIAGYPDILVVADSVDDAKQKTRDRYIPEPNTRLSGFVWVRESTEQVIL